jgi:hypothetical protein
MSDFDVVPRTKQVSDDQSYEYRVIGGSMKITYNFFGEQWESFFRMLAQEHCLLAHAVYFFGWNFWLGKYAPRLRGWTFVCNKNGVKLPQKSDKHDELVLKVNGKDLAELWADWKPTEDENECAA